MLVNQINISYCAIKLLPYSDGLFVRYQCERTGLSFFAQRANQGTSIFASFVNSVGTLGVAANANFDKSVNWCIYSIFSYLYFQICKYFGIITIHCFLNKQTK